MLHAVVELPGLQFARQWSGTIASTPSLVAVPSLDALLQVFYYLRELDEAVNYALGAGTLFDVNDKSEYVQTLIGVPLLELLFKLHPAGTYIQSHHVVLLINIMHTGSGTVWCGQRLRCVVPSVVTPTLRLSSHSQRVLANHQPHCTARLRALPVGHACINHDTIGSCITSVGVSSLHMDPEELSSRLRAFDSPTSQLWSRG